MAKQIHQLPAYSGTPVTSDMLALDSGSETTRVTMRQVSTATDNTGISFTSNDVGDPSDWASLPLIYSGSSKVLLFNRISIAVRNLRYLFKILGSTDFSASGKTAVTDLLGNTSIASVGDGTLTGAVSNINGRVTPLTADTGGTATYVSNAQFANANGIRYEVRGKTIFITVNMTRASGAAATSDFVNIASVPFQIDNNGTNNAFYSALFTNQTTSAWYQLRFNGASGKTNIGFYASNTVAGQVRATFAFALV